MTTHSWIAFWNRHDVDGALALMTDDCVWEVTRGREPHRTLYTGRAAVRSAIVEAFKALPDVNYQPVRNSFGENHVVVELLVTGTLGDGKKATTRGMLALRNRFWTRAQRQGRVGLFGLSRAREASGGSARGSVARVWASSSALADDLQEGVVALAVLPLAGPWLQLTPTQHGQGRSRPRGWARMKSTRLGRHDATSDRSGSERSRLWPVVRDLGLRRGDLVSASRRAPGGQPSGRAHPRGPDRARADSLVAHRRRDRSARIPPDRRCFLS
jgi:ketosteroid isomerase-like protein